MKHPKDKQQEIDALYTQYLMISYMKETMKKNYKDEEEHLMVYFSPFLD